MKSLKVMSRSIWRRLSFILRGILGLFVSSFGSNRLRVYWYRVGVNFGDWITPYLLQKYGFKPCWVQVNDADYLSTGSILEHITIDYKGTVLGSGFISEHSDSGCFTDAQITGVRGKKTASKLSLENSKLVLGDPGLLCSKFVVVPTSQKWKVGIVPHFNDANSPVVEELKRSNPNDILVIDVLRKPEEVWEDLASCEVILSSSLHGLICSDSLQIPTCWIEFSNKVIGAGYKFHDYYSSFDEQLRCKNLTGEETIEQLQALCKKRDKDRLFELIDGLDQMFKSLP